MNDRDRRLAERRVSDERRAAVSAFIADDRRSRAIHDRRLAVRNQITSLRQADWYERYHAARLG